MSMHRYDVFLSYTSADKSIVEALAHRLVKVGLHPWFDAWSLIPGTTWQEALEEALAACATCAVCIGPHGSGAWQHEEMRAAIDRRVHDSRNGFRVIPVLLPGAERGERSTLPPFLTATTWVEFRQGLDDERAFHRLVCGIRGIEPGPVPSEATYADTTPYRGLQVFDVADWPFFFGREALIEWLLDAVRPSKNLHPENRFLGIIGPSGSGKSSLARAGLAAALKQGKIAGSEHWPIAICKPGADPVESLAVAVCAITADDRNVTAVRSLIHDLGTDPRTLHLVTRLTLRDAPAERRLVVLVDQFEELFTICRDDAVRQAAIDTLLHAATAHDGQTIVILTLRADFYGKCATYPQLAAALSDHQMLVGPMTRDEIRRAIERPALLAGCEFEPGLVETLLDDVIGQPGTLPLLQHALLELWNRRVGRQLTHAAYRKIGGVAGALEQRAEMVYAAFDATEQAICRRIFLRLTQLGEGTEDTRRRATMHELLPSEGNIAAFDMVLRKLTGPEARLVTGQGEPDDSDKSHSTDHWDDQMVEVAHEALIRSWPRLRRWLDEDRVALRVHRQLTEAAEEWATKQHDTSYLYQGARLVEAREWAEKHADDLNAEERAFLQASMAAWEALQAQEAKRKAHEAALERRSQNVLRVLVGVSLIATIGAFMLTAQTKRQLVITNAQRLALAAQSQMRNAPETALLLAYEAVARYHDPVTEQALRDALDQVLWQPTILTGHTDVVGRATFSRDGRQILTASDDGTARLWDLSGQSLTVFQGHTHAVEGAEFSADGRQILTASNDGTARLWDLSGQSLTVFQGHTDVVQTAIFSADGQQVLTASNDGTARLWYIHGQLLTTFNGHTDIVQSAVFSPGSQHVLTASYDGTARLWDLSGQLLTTFNGHTSGVERAEFSPDGQQVLTASIDGTARLWDLSGQLLTTFTGHTSGVQSAMFSPDGQHVLTVSLDQTARLWDLSGQLLTTLNGHTDRVNRAQFSPDGQYILTASLDQTARLWDLSGKQLAVFSHIGRVTSVAFGPDGKWILTASFDQTARLWSLVGPPLVTFHDDVNGLNSAIYSADGRQVLTASSDKTARLWDVNGQLLMVFNGHAEPLDRARFSQDEQYVITSSPEGTVGLWDLSGRQLATFRHTAQVFADATSPEGQRVITASDDGTVGLWDLSGKQLATFNGHTDEVSSARFSPDGRQVLTTSKDGTARLWDVSGHLLTVFKGHTKWVIRAVFSPDGQRVVTVSDDDTARLWDLSGRQLAIFRHTDRVVRAVFSPDGQRVVTISQDATARLWHLSGKQLAVFSHTGRVVRAAFSPDGRYVVAASADKTARLWNISGQLLSTFNGHTDALETAVFSPNGRRILTTSKDGTVRQYLVNVQDVLAVAACRVGRGLTKDEIDRFKVDAPRFDFAQRTCPPALP